MGELGSDPLAGVAATLVRAAADAATADTLLAVDPGAEARTASTEVTTARYEHLSILGEGGMGRVDRVRDRDLEREVAVKHLRFGDAADAQSFAQFVWEARVTARLDHPNIVPLHDLAAGKGGRLFFTMKLVRGRTLGDVVDDASIDLPRRLRMFLAVCQAIAFAHSRGVLHRDLKPGNVMVGEYGEVLVTDWGLALPLPDARGDALRALAPPGLATTSAGTPAYMSPEQARGEPLDARSDVFSLGTILYELVARRPAFEGPTIALILAKVVSGDAPALAGVAQQAPTSVVAIVSKAMAVDPAERYGDVHALLADVEAFLDGGTPAAEHASLARRAARYYVGRDRALARLRVVDLDFWMGGSFILGIGIGAHWAHHVAARWWLVALFGLLLALPTTVRWLRLRREVTSDRR